MMRIAATPVALTIPCDSRWTRLVRLTGSGVAVACGLTLDATEDFRLMVDEVCSAMIDASDATAPVHIEFRMTPGSIVIEGSTHTRPLRQPNEVRDALGRRILDALAESHQFSRDGDHLVLVASYRLRARGVG